MKARLTEDNCGCEGLSFTFPCFCATLQRGVVNFCHIFNRGKYICRGKMDLHCIEGQLSGKSTPTNVGPFSPLSLSFTPPSGPLLVSFSPADISVMTLSEPYSLCFHAVPGLDAEPVRLTESLPGMFRIFIGPRNVNND